MYETVAENAMKYILLSIINIIVLSGSVFSQEKNVQQLQTMPQGIGREQFADNEKFTVHVFVNGYLGYSNVPNLQRWVDDESDQYLLKIKQSDNVYSSYTNKRSNSVLGKNSLLPFGCNLGSDFFYGNFGIGLDCSAVLFITGGGSTGYDGNGNKKYGSFWTMYWIDIAPSLYYRQYLCSFGDGNVHLRFGIGFNLITLNIKYDIGELLGDEKPLFYNEYPKNYQDISIGYHANIGISYDVGLLAFLVTVNYTHVYFDSIKEKNGSEVMRYSDGRIVSTKINMITLSLGAGIHIGW